MSGVKSPRPNRSSHCKRCGSDDEGDSLWLNQMCQICWERCAGNLIWRLSEQYEEGSLEEVVQYLEGLSNG